MKLRLLSALTLAVLPLCADFTPSGWKLRKRILIPENANLVHATVDHGVYAGAQPDLSDMRVIRGAEETPFLLTQMSSQTESTAIPADLLNKSTTAAGALQVTLDMKRVQRHNRVDFDVIGDNFRCRVRVDASDDNRSWSTIRKAAYLFRYDADSGKIANLSVQYPDSTRRYLRVTVEDWDKPEDFVGASVRHWREVPARRSVVATIDKPTGVFDSKTKSTVYEIDLGTRTPKDLLRIETAKGLFHRNVNVEHSFDRKLWSWLGSGAIYRTPEEESLTIPLPEGREQYLRVRVYQGDDKPVEIARLAAEGVDRRVTFPAGGGGEYWLYYGNKSAGRPSYDLPMVLAKSSLESAKASQLGNEESNAGYIPPAEPVKPWTDRNPALLYATLGAAVLGLGYLTVRFLKQAGPGNAPQD